MKDCNQEKLRIEQKADNKTSQYCSKWLKQKSNGYQQVKSQYEDGTVDDHTDAGKIVGDSVVPLTFVPKLEPDF